MWPGNSLKVRSREPVVPGEWTHIAVSYNGSSRAAGIEIHVDGERAELEVIRDGLWKDITYEGGEPDLALGYRFRDNGFRAGQVADLRVFPAALTTLESRWLAHTPAFALDASEQASDSPQNAAPAAGDTNATIPSAHDALRRILDEATEDELWQHFWQREFADAQPLRHRLAELRREHNNLIHPIPEIMVMKELSNPKPAYVLRRGEYDQHGEAVTADTPTILPPFPEDAPRSRLGLAQWLLDPNHPLMARVTVNRIWQMLLGRGIVDTPDNFGFQGSSPTHPELLDWLAREFIDGGWDQKDLVRRIVLSTTYRQSGALPPSDHVHSAALTTTSGMDARLSTPDPENRWLTRGPSRRLTAEMLRDQALATSGLLVERLGGPSVKPYQPEGLWDIAMGKPRYEVSQGADQYRRSLYTYWKRTVPPPAMVTFDAAERNNCSVQRQSTSTPLQALVLLNDPQFTEAARALGRRMFREGGETPAERVAWLFQLLTSRLPTVAERQVLEQLFEEQLALYQASPSEARRFLELADGAEDLTDQQMAELAAAGVLASALLNHDEAVMRR
jgi:hypothetical protein